MSQCESRPSTEESVPPSQKKSLPHSRYGVISLILTLGAIILPYVLLLICVHFKLENEIGLLRIIAIGFFYVILAEVAAFTLGNVGLYQPHTRKVFSILGIVFSLCFLVPAIVLTTIGISEIITIMQKFD